MVNLDLTSPRLESKLENGAFCPLRRFILEFKGCGGNGGFAAPFYSIQDCSITFMTFINMGTFYVHELFGMLQCNNIGNLLS